MPTIEEFRERIREATLTPEQLAQKRFNARERERPPNDLDIGIEAFNRGLGDKTNREQKLILNEAIQRGLVTRSIDGKLQTDLSGPVDLSFAPGGDARKTQLLEDLGILNIPSARQSQRIERREAFQSRKSFGQQIVEDVKRRPFKTAGEILSKPAAGVTGLFAAAGDALDQNLQRLGVLEGEAPQTPGEAGRRIGKAGLEGAGIGIIAKGLGKVFSPFGKSVTPEGAAAIQTTRSLPGGKELNFPIEKATNSSILDAAGNMAEVAILTSTEKFAQGESVSKAIDLGFKAITSDLSKGRTKEQIADTVSLIVTQGKKMFSKTRNRLYESIDDLNPTIQRITAQKGFKKKLLEDGTESAELIERVNPQTGLIENIPNLEAKDVITKGGVNLGPVIAFMKNALSKEENPLEKLPEIARNLGLMEKAGPIRSFKASNNIASDIGDFGFAANVPDKEQGLARVISKMIKKQMDKGATQLPRDALKRFKIAKRFAQIGFNVYGRTVIKNMLKDTKSYTPENVWNMVKNAGPENIKLIRELMEPRKFIQKVEGRAAGIRPKSTQINEKTFWQNVQGRFLADLTKMAEGDVKQKPIINKIDEAIESGRFKEMFPGPRGRLAAENFKRLAETKNVQLKPNPTGRLGLMVQVGQPLQAITVGSGALTALLGEPEVGAGIAGLGIALFLLPEAIAQLVVRRRMAMWLINQNKIGGDVAKGTQAVLSLGNVLNAEKIPFEFINPNQQQQGIR